MTNSSLQSNSDKASTMFSSSITMSHMSLGSVMSSVCEPYTVISRDILEAPAILDLPLPGDLLQGDHGCVIFGESQFMLRSSIAKTGLLFG